MIKTKKLNSDNSLIYCELQQIKTVHQTHVYMNYRALICFSLTFLESPLSRPKQSYLITWMAWKNKAKHRTKQHDSSEV